MQGEIKEEEEKRKDGRKKRIKIETGKTDKTSYQNERIRIDPSRSKYKKKKKGSERSYFKKIKREYNELRENRKDAARIHDKDYVKKNRKRKY